MDEKMSMNGKDKPMRRISLIGLLIAVLSLTAVFARAASDAGNIDGLWVATVGDDSIGSA
jgi:hypothetical protein